LQTLHALSSLDFCVGRSLRCQAVVSQPNGMHRLATVATPGRANHSDPQKSNVDKPLGLLSFNHKAVVLQSAS